MSDAAPYMPMSVFLPPAGSSRAPPRAFIAPQRYVQGPGVLGEVGRYLAITRLRHAAILMSARGARGEGPALEAGLRAAGIAATHCIFDGEASLQEIERHAGALRGSGVDCLIALGGGKCVDAGKAIAHRIGVPAVIVPTLASNDAPCSALSVLYTPDGVYADVEFYPLNPLFVIVDTEIVAAAPERFLVAGMGDAMATWYEARACRANPASLNAAGAGQTIAACAIGEACAHTLFEHGLAAASAVNSHRIDSHLEAVVEANTLLSGLGFESGGVAVAHGIAQSFTAVPAVHAHYLHGEEVAMGTLAQLMLEGQPEDARRVATFFAAVGLPIHLGQVSLAASDHSAIDIVVDGTMAWPYTANMPMAVTAPMIRDAILAADTLGRAVAGTAGDAAWRRLHGHA
jgi:glycerol dehydrogenase